ncbi:MAG TPA: MarP family serine protease [Actinomycetota bacterium]|nr:MarP family serine protease [Actinomycetota bacterium]
MNGLDLVIVILVALTAFTGFRRGALLQLFSYAGLILGVLAGALLAPVVASQAQSDALQAGIVIAVLLGMAGIGDLLGWVAGTSVRARAHGVPVVGTADKAGGSAISVVGLLLVTWFLALNLVNGPFPRVNIAIRGSAIVRSLDAVLPRPPSLPAEVRRFLNRHGFPDVFAGLPPAPTGPVDMPSEAQARRAFQAAEASTVRIVGSACGELLSGSGFVVSGDYVVTNAHVIAGVHGPQVQGQDGTSRPGTTVLFDPSTDLAVLHVESSAGQPLALLSSQVGRGTGGATLGYPGGGDLTGTRAAVRRPIDAVVGRDIYGTREVERDVYELQARVEPGDSGGPFVLPDGSVAGIVFAASTTDPSVGYAIASTDVIPDVSRAVGRTHPVSTGGCVR